MSCNGCTLNIDYSRPSMLDTHDWLNDIPDTSELSDFVEVRFKSTRKEYYRNTYSLSLKRGDTVVVATSPGHDVGIVTLTGYLAEKQYNRKIKNKSRYTLNNIYRKANNNDIKTWDDSKDREKPTMIRAREIAIDLNLSMKIGDVEFRGDGNKVIIYYISNGRVDFRELIKRYAREFRVRIEMKQIGARQEAGRIGGIGSCGRELCCSSWRTDFSSITTESITRQGLSPSANKMAGACGKLKCCLMYELDNYIEAGEDFPSQLLDLETENGIAKQLKTDFLSKTIWYSININSQIKTYKLSTEEVKDIIQKNKRGIKPLLTQNTEPVEATVEAAILENSLTRFDKVKPKRRNDKRRKPKKHNYKRNTKKN